MNIIVGDMAADIQAWGLNSEFRAKLPDSETQGQEKETGAGF